jgi:hypothetical protein
VSDESFDFSVPRTFSNCFDFLYLLIYFCPGYDIIPINQPEALDCIFHASPILTSNDDVIFNSWENIPHIYFDHIFIFS